MGDSSIKVSEDIYNTSETILYFFESYVHSAIDWRNGNYYSDIVEHFHAKFLL